jgi:hypothetical protein
VSLLLLLFAVAPGARAADTFTLERGTPAEPAPLPTTEQIAALEARCTAGDGDACFQLALVPDADGALSRYDAMIAAGCKAGHAKSCEVQAQMAAVFGALPADVMGAAAVKPGPGSAPAGGAAGHGGKPTRSGGDGQTDAEGVAAKPGTSPTGKPGASVTAGASAAPAGPAPTTSSAAPAVTPLSPDMQAAIQASCLAGQDPARCVQAAGLALGGTPTAATDLTLGVPYLEAGCSHHDGPSCFALAGLRAQTGDVAGAATLLRGGCDAGEGEACAKLGGLLMLAPTGGATAGGSPGDAASGSTAPTGGATTAAGAATGDQAGAFAAFDKGCALDDAEACASLGIFYATGTVVPPDLRHGLELTERSCKQGFADACPVADKLRARLDGGANGGAAAGSPEGAAKTGKGAGGKGTRGKGTGTKGTGAAK